MASPRGPSGVIKDRLHRFRSAMAARGHSAYLITNRFDHYYLTGFTGEDSAALITGKSVHLISDGRFETSIKRESPWARVSMRKGALVDEIVSVLGKSRLKRFAIQSQHVSAAMRATLARKLRGIKIVDAPDLVGPMRSRKDASEMRNTAADHPEITQRLKRLHDQWIIEVTK